MGSAGRRKLQDVRIRTGSQRHIELEMRSLKVVRDISIRVETADAHARVMRHKGAPSGFVRAHQVTAEATGRILSRQYTLLGFVPSEICAARTDPNVSG